MIAFQVLKTKGILKLDIPGDGLELGLEEVRGIVFSLYKQWKEDHGTFDYFPVFELLQENWCWKEGTGKTLIQRICKILGKDGFRLDKGYLGELGNSIREAIPMLKEYHIDITQDFDWTDGEFADSGSCMWDGRNTVKTQMSKDGRFYALRFFKPEPESESPFWTTRRIHVGYTGTGRSWLFCENIQVRINNKVFNEEILIIFNSYGHALRQQAAILASLTGLSSKKITLSNKKRTTGGLFINNGGYVIGPPHIIETIAHFDFGFENKFDGEDVEIEVDNMPLTLDPIFHSAFDRMTRSSRKKNKKFFQRANRRVKKSKTRRYRRSNNTIDRIAYSFNNDTIYHALTNRSQPKGYRTKDLYHWRLYQRLLQGRFFSILMRILSHKITNGGLNDNPEKKT